MLYPETPDMCECVSLDQGTQVTLDAIGKVCVRV